MPLLSAATVRSFVFSPVFHFHFPVSVVPSGSCGFRVTIVPAGSVSVGSVRYVLCSPPSSLCSTLIPLYSMMGVSGVGICSEVGKSRVFINTE